MGDRFAISDLTRTKCLVPVFGSGNGPLFSDYLRFFHAPGLRIVELTSAMHTHAAAICDGNTYPTTPPVAPKRFGLADPLHLAAAIESGCDVFLTNAAQLAGFPEITVEILP